MLTKLLEAYGKTFPRKENLKIFNKLVLTLPPVYETVRAEVTLLPIWIIPLPRNNVRPF